jgi:hypothetical protein
VKNGGIFNLISIKYIFSKKIMKSDS